MPELLLKDEVYVVIGAAIDVHKELGSGFLEAVYQEAMELELRWRGIPFEPQKELCIYYKGQCLEKKYIADLICVGSILVELKAMKEIGSREESQMLITSRPQACACALIINFGDEGRLDWKRLVR